MAQSSTQYRPETPNACETPIGAYPLHGVQGRGDDIQEFYRLAKGKSWKKVPGSSSTYVLFLEEKNVVFTARVTSRGTDILLYEESRADFIRKYEAKEHIDYIVVPEARVKYDSIRMIAAMKAAGLW